MSSVSAKFEVYNPKDEYTSGDWVKGKVTIRLGHSTSVKEIVIKLKGEVHTKVVVMVRNKLRTKHGYEKLYQKQAVLFPPADLPLQGSSGFTLPAGDHVYEFALRFPGHEGDNYKVLPPTCKTARLHSEFNVDHILKVTVRRLSTFAMNTRVEKLLQFDPSADVEALSRMPITVCRRTEMVQSQKTFWGFQRSGPADGIQAAVEITFPPVIAQNPLSIPLGVRIQAMNKKAVYQLSGVEFQLIRIDHLRTDMYGLTEQESPIVLFSGHTDMRGSRIDAAELLQQRALSRPILSSFNTRSLTTEYQLTARVRVVELASNKSSEIKISEPVAVLPRHYYKVGVGPVRILAGETALPEKTGTGLQQSSGSALPSSSWSDSQPGSSQPGSSQYNHSQPGSSGPSASTGATEPSISDTKAKQAPPPYSLT